MNSSRLLRKLKLVLGVCTLGFTFQQGLQATLLVYEGFDGYTPGQLAGQAVTNTVGLSGSYVVAGTAAPSNAIAFQSTGLTFGTLNVTGGSIIQTSTTSGGSLGVNFSGVSVTSGTIWTSYLFSASAFGNTSQVQLGVNTTDSATSNRYFTSSADGTGSLPTVGYDTTATNGIQNSPLVNTTYITIARFTNLGTTDGSGVANLWTLSIAQYNNLALGGITEAELDAITTVGTGATVARQLAQDTNTSGSAFTLEGALQLSLRSNVNGQTYTMDELHIGTTLDDMFVVVPEPNTTSLLLSSAIFCLMLRRYASRRKVGSLS